MRAPQLDHVAAANTFNEGPPGMNGPQQKVRVPFAMEVTAERGAPVSESAGGAKANQNGLRRARESSLWKFKWRAPAALGLLLFEEMVPEAGVNTAVKDMVTSKVTVD